MWTHTKGIVYESEIIKVDSSGGLSVLGRGEKWVIKCLTLTQLYGRFQNEENDLMENTSRQPTENGTLKYQQNEDICLLIWQGTKEDAEFGEDWK